MQIRQILFVTTFFTIVFCASFISAQTSQASESVNVIHLQHGSVTVRSPESWVIIKHQVGSTSDLIAFQILDPADEGTDDSTNVSVIAFDLRVVNTALKFTQSVLEHGKLKHPEKENGKWLIYTWHSKQEETNYEIRDCYLTSNQYGIYVRLAFPKLEKTTKEWSTKLEVDFKQLLDTLEVRQMK